MAGWLALLPFERNARLAVLLLLFLIGGVLLIAVVNSGPDAIAYIVYLSVFVSIPLIVLSAIFSFVKNKIGYPAYTIFIVAISAGFGWLQY